MNHWQSHTFEGRAFKVVLSLTCVAISLRLITDIIIRSDIRIILVSAISLIILSLLVLLFYAGKKNSALTLYVTIFSTSSLYMLSWGGIESRTPYGFIIFTIVLSVILKKGVRRYFMTFYFGAGLLIILAREQNIFRIEDAITRDNDASKAFLYIIVILLCVILIFLMKNAYDQERQTITARNAELDTVNGLIKEGIRKIKINRALIKRINFSLEEKVKERTKELESRNAVIEQYAFANAHLVRGPLARILGLAALLEMEGEKTEELRDLLRSAQSLDEVIREINQILT